MSAATDKELVLCNDSWHILQHEAGADLLLAKIIDWITQRVPEGRVRNLPIGVRMGERVVRAVEVHAGS